MKYLFSVRTRECMARLAVSMSDKSPDIIAGRSMSSFVRLFHKEVGAPPMQYLNRYRIQQAKRLLEHSDRSIAEIAEMVGIPRANYFTRLFSDVVGVSPTRYRARQAQRPSTSTRTIPRQR